MENVVEIEDLKVFARKLVERCNDAEAKAILLAACDSGDVYGTIIITLDASKVPLKKERKKRAKKEKPPDPPGAYAPYTGPGIPVPKGRSRKTMKAEVDT